MSTAIRCPECREIMVPKKVNDVVIDQCPLCAGVWLDCGELDRLAPPPTGFLRRPKLKTDSRRAPVRGCPRCTGESLVRQFSDPHSQCELEICWNCAGIWFDFGELDLLLDRVKSREEAQRAADQIVDSVLAEFRRRMAELTESQLQQAKVSRIQRIRQALGKLFQSSGSE